MRRNPTTRIIRTLSEAGRARAQNLALFIPAKYGKPDFVFAAAVNEKSIRLYLTMRPLCDAIAVPLDSGARAKAFQGLATKLLSDAVYAAKLVVACWTHGELPALAAALRAPQDDYPDPWDPSVFDLILQLDYGMDAPPVVTRVLVRVLRYVPGVGHAYAPAGRWNSAIRHRFAKRCCSLSHKIRQCKPHILLELNTSTICVLVTFFGPARALFSISAKCPSIGRVRRGLPA